MPWQQLGTKRNPGKGKEREKTRGDEKEKEEIDRAFTGTREETIKLIGR